MLRICRKNVDIMLVSKRKNERAAGDERLLVGQSNVFSGFYGSHRRLQIKRSDKASLSSSTKDSSRIETNFGLNVLTCMRQPVDPIIEIGFGPSHVLRLSSATALPGQAGSGAAAACDEHFTLIPLSFLLIATPPDEQYNNIT
nr:hypothetical protein Iba_chr03bCG9640 [Ipomoea batatas]